MSAADVFEAWGLSPAEADRFLSAHQSRAVLVTAHEGWLVPSAAFYGRVRDAQRAAGKKAQANLRQYRKAPASTSSPKSGPVAPSTPAPKRELSAQERCWDFLDHMAVEHCTELGLIRESQQRPKLCNPKLTAACTAAGIVDFLLDGKAYTRWEHLGVLFALYLKDELGRVDRDGQLRTPPWPIELFLSENVLRRFKAQEEKAA